jgi:hypothetical protein
MAVLVGGRMVMRTKTMAGPELYVCGSGWTDV